MIFQCRLIPQQIQTYPNLTARWKTCFSKKKKIIQIKFQIYILLNASLKASTQNAMDINKAKISSEDLESNEETNISFHGSSICKYMSGLLKINNCFQADCIHFLLSIQIDWLKEVSVFFMQIFTRTILSHKDLLQLIFWF